MVKSRRRWSSASVPASTCGLLGSQRPRHVDAAAHHHHVDVGRGAPQVVVAHVAAYHIGIDAQPFGDARNASEKGIGKGFGHGIGI